MTDTKYDPTDWTMDLGEDGAYPFTESEDADITGPGHQDPAEFAAAVNRYDATMNGAPFPEDEQWTAEHICHRWAVLGEYNGEPCLWARQDDKPVTAETPGAIAITTLWGER